MNTKGLGGLQRHRLYLVHRGSGNAEWMFTAVGRPLVKRGLLIEHERHAKDTRRARYTLTTAAVVLLERVTLLGWRRALDAQRIIDKL